jgi:tetratricopeptide (TPR) repeat protein
MEDRVARILGLFVLGMGLILILPCSGQFREYYIFGKVLDTQKNPLERVEITVRDVLSNRSYTVKTNKDGEFKFVGLPHATYKVVLEKEGYAVKEDEWKLATPQNTMQRIEMPAIVLASLVQIEEVQRLKEVDAGIKESADKIRQGDMDGAIAQLKGMLDKDPKNANALFLVGMAYAKKRMYPEASGAFLQVTELAPKFAAAFYQLGVSYQEVDEPDKAIEAYKKALDLDPANFNAFYNSGLILFKLSRVDEALERFERAVVLKPDDPAFLEMAGRCYINKADYPKAIEYLEKAKAGYNDPERTKFLDELIATLKAQIKK